MTHPLDKAITFTKDQEKYLGILYYREHADYLYNVNKHLTIAVISLPDGRKYELLNIAAYCAKKLKFLGTDTPWEAMKKAYNEHGHAILPHTKNPSRETWYYAAIERLGRIAETLSRDRRDMTATYITQLGVITLAWLAHELEKDNQ